MAEDSIRIKNLPNVLKEPNYEEVLVTDGNETNGLESSYLCHLEANFGGRFSETQSYEPGDICVRNGERWKFNVHHEPGPFNLSEVSHANFLTANQVYIVEYGTTPAAFAIAVAANDGYAVFVSGVPVPGVVGENIAICSLQSIKDEKIYFVGVVNDKVINVVLDASGESEQWSVSETPVKQVFVATYGETTLEDISNAFNSGKLVRVGFVDGLEPGSHAIMAYSVSSVVGDGELVFSATSGKKIYNFHVNSQNAWSYDVYDLSVSDAPVYDFATPADYAAHTKSTSVSEVSLVEAPKTVYFDGVNVERNSNPCISDALYVDGDGNKHFIAGNTYVPASLPSDYTSVGVVVARKGDKALILHKDENTGVKFASCWQHEITGLADHLGTEITIQFRQALTSGNINIGSPLVFTPATLAEAAAAIDTHLRANPGGTAAGAGWNYNWHCELTLNYAGEESVIVTSDNIVDYRQANAIVDTSASTSGITGTMNMCNFLPAYGDSTMLRVNGGFGYRPGWNFERLKQWATTNTTIATPSSMVSVHDGSNTVSQDQFENNQYCADLRAEYVTFDNYIKSLMLRWPVRKGGQWSLYGTGKGNTEQLASKTHLNLAGDTVDTFSAAKWSASKSFDSDGLRLGDWYMPQMDECFDIFAPMKLDGSDPVNATLKKMTGNARSLSVSRWVPARHNGANAWIMNPNGYFNFNSFNNNNPCAAVALLTINP